MCTQSCKRTEHLTADQAQRPPCTCRRHPASAQSQRHRLQTRAGHRQPTHLSLAGNTLASKVLGFSVCLGCLHNADLHQARNEDIGPRYKRMGEVPQRSKPRQERRPGSSHDTACCARRRHGANARCALNLTTLAASTRLVCLALLVSSQAQALGSIDLQAGNFS